MAEGYSYKPDDETVKPKSESVELPAPKLDAPDRFKNFLGELFKEKKEQGSEEEEEDDTPEAAGKGRFGRIWSKLFPSVAEKEDVTDPAAEKPEGFFATPADEHAPEDAAATLPPDALYDQPQPAAIEYAVPGIETVPTEVAEDARLEDAPLPFEAAPTEPDAEVVESFDTPDDVPEMVPLADLMPEAERAIIDRSANASPVSPAEVAADQTVDHRYYGYGGMTPYERHRLNKVEQREQENRKRLKQLPLQGQTLQQGDSLKNKETSQPPVPSFERAAPPTERTVPPVFRTPEVRRAAQKTDVLKRESVERKIEQKHEVKPASSEKVITTEAVTHELETTKEVEKAYEAAAEMQKYIEKAETTDTKEIAHELSHEHKDMDKQSMASWAALQASASATAEANAKALADAQSVIALRSDAVVASKDATVQEPKSLYKTAVVSGMVTAVIIIAIIIVILLVQSR